jgi:hypothetical protein
MYRILVYRLHWIRDRQEQVGIYGICCRFKPLNLETMQLLKTNFVWTFLFSFLLLIQNNKSQNLVPNPSFEVYKSCPSMQGQVDSTIGWISFCRSPDYFNSCAQPTTGCSVPYNFFAYQAPSTGNAYSGLATYDSMYRDIREFEAIELFTPLTKGVRYYVSFKTCLAYSFDLGTAIATNNIGVRFTTFRADNWNNCLSTTNFAHVFDSTVIKDTLQWSSVRGSFVADSNYSYVVLGNFFDDAHTTRWYPLYHIQAFAYYFIDDVCVTSDSANCSLITDVTVRLDSDKPLVYFDGESRTIKILGRNDKDRRCLFELFDINGSRICSQDPILSGEVEIILASLSANLYYFVIQVEGGARSTGRLYVY